MREVEIKIIPEHVAYTAEYKVNDYNDFYNEETGENMLAELDELMHSENPGVYVPEIPDDYNYFEHEAGQPVTSPMHIRYYDMVNKAGKDTDKYKFVTVPEVKAATMMHEGPFETVGETYSKLYEWIVETGYFVNGPGRSSCIHGPWDRENRSEYLIEVQIPIK